MAMILQPCFPFYFFSNDLCARVSSILLFQYFCHQQAHYLSCTWHPHLAFLNILAHSFQDFRQLLEENLGGLQLSNLIIVWVREGFQDFFRALHDRLLLISGKNKSASQDENSTEGMQVEKVIPGLVLVLAQLSVFIEQTAIPRITEARSHSQFHFIFLLTGTTS